MSGNLASLRSNPDLSPPMTTRQMERELTHLAAKVKMLSEQIKAVESARPSRRVVAAMISESRKRQMAITDSRLLDLEESRLTESIVEQVRFEVRRRARALKRNFSERLSALERDGKR